MDKGDSLDNFRSLYDITLRDLKNWGVEGWIGYGIQIWFFKDVQEGINTLRDRDGLVGWLEEKEQFEDLAWLQNELIKLEEKLNKG